ncbi:MAG: signal peptidase I [Clostridiales bacterium]|nr:signal peptidase I [Clostridiales bacterium]
MKKAVSVFSALLMAVLIVAVAVLVLPRLFGAKLFAVLSPSMEPAYSTGDVVYTFPTEVSEIKQGDVISYVLDESLTVVTHRVVSKDDASRHLITKGDANETEDTKPVLYDNIVGVVKFSLPKLGYLTGFLSTLYGKLTAAAFVVFVAMFALLCGDDKKNGKSKKVKNQADAVSAQESEETPEK